MVRQYAPKQSAALNKAQRGVILYRTAEKNLLLVQRATGEFAHASEPTFCHHSRDIAVMCESSQIGFEVEFDETLSRN